MMIDLCSKRRRCMFMGFPKTTHRVIHRFCGYVPVWFITLINEERLHESSIFKNEKVFIGIFSKRGIMKKIKVIHKKLFLSS
ncbi:MAG: hypothetical protein QM652_07990 [Legionella sp.]